MRGASKGEGLGNQFLANIREVDAIVHVLRCFASDDITHVEGSVDPLRDAETIETELMLCDLDSLERRISPLEKKAKSGDKDAKIQVAVMTRILEALRDGKPGRSIDDWSAEEQKIVAGMQLLTTKPVLFVCNVDEESSADGNEFSAKVFEMAKAEGAVAVVISAAIESEIAQLSSAEEKAEFLETLGLEETGLTRVIRAGSSGRKPSPMTISSPAAARAAPRKPARCGLKARNIW